MVRDQGLAQGYGVAWGTVRNYPMYKVSLNDGMTFLGYFPGRHRVLRRETHLVCGRLSPQARAARVAPAPNWIYEIPLVQEIIHEMGLNQRVGSYPKDVVTGPGATGCVNVGFDFQATDSAMEITYVSEDVEALPEYMQVTLLADKVRHIEFFLRLGFRMCAFLPGWFTKGERRYDCVLMSNSVAAAVLEDERLSHVMGRFIRSYDGGPPIWRNHHPIFGSQRGSSVPK